MTDLGRLSRLRASEPADDTFLYDVFATTCFRLPGGLPSNVADFLPTRPADFFNLVGMAEWFALDTKLAHLEDH